MDRPAAPQRNALCPSQARSPNLTRPPSGCAIKSRNTVPFVPHPWEFIGELGVEAGTCALWDKSLLPVEFQITYPEEPPGLPTAFISNIGDDIDGGVEIIEGQDPVVALRVVFVDNVDELENEVKWRTVGELDLPTGQLVLADPYCHPIVPYRQEFHVEPGRWAAEQLHWEGDLEAVRIRWARALS